MQINCNNCHNPIGELKNKVIEINFKRVNNIKHDFENKQCVVKCRKCSAISVLRYEDKFINTVDQFLTSRELL